MSAAEEAFYVVGVATRTTNADERDPSTARLPDLWQRAYRDPYLTERGAELVAVLTDYAGDHTGAYTQVVGVRAESAADLPERLVAVRVPAEPRHRVRARGTMPDALVAAWQQIWAQTDAGELQRSYRTDYEVHTDAGADIYLSTQQDQEPSRAR